MTTPGQIRAARVLLNIDAADLAAETGLSRATISNIETGVVQPREDSMIRIRAALEARGIEFIGDRGVARVHENYRLIEGPDCYLRLLDEIYHALRGQAGAEVLFICVDDSVSSPEVRDANERIRKAGIRCRYLSSDQARRFDFPRDAYRLIPSRLFKNSVMVVFGDRVATLRGVNGAVLVIADRDQAEMLRGLFEVIWAAAHPPAKAAP
jgi:transcriptional regulator with XRE-family HTH domain